MRNVSFLISHFTSLFLNHCLLPTVYYKQFLFCCR